MSEKPEWFQLTGDDETPKQPITKSKKRFLKVALFTAPLLLVGGAMVFAEGNGPDDVPNINTAIPSSNTATTTSSSNSGSVIDSTNSTTPKQSSNVTTSPNAPVAPNANISKGAGVAAPSARGEDDHEGFNGERDHRDGAERPHHDDHDGNRNGSGPTIPNSGIATTNN